jgi:uncharacterized protein YndB with AHSA1/START domain
MSTVLTVSSTVNAPIELVWQAFTQPEHITQWNFAADTWECPTASNDLRVGGAFSYRMQAKDASMGFDFAGTYSNVVPLKQIDYTIGERTVSVTFEKLSSEQTKITQAFEAEDQNSLELQQNGWQAILEQFKRHVESLGTSEL